MSQSTGVRLPRLWGWFALLVLAISTALFLEFDERDLRRHVLSWRGDRGIAASGNVAVNVEGPVLADTTYAVWMVSRNAYTLTNRPSRLFDAEHCAPAKRTISPRGDQSGCGGTRMYTARIQAPPPAAAATSTSSTRSSSSAGRASSGARALRA